MKRTEINGKKTLAIVDSPLQVMMANEYVKEYGIQNVDYLISVHSVDYLKKNRSVLRYLNDLDEKYKVYITHNLIKTFRYINSPKVYEQFIIGDFRSLDKKLLTLFHAKNRFDIIYVDDGNAAFDLETGYTASNGIRKVIISFVDKLINKRVITKKYFSAFLNNKNEINGIQIVPNKMNSLRITEKSESNDVIIIGCHSSMFYGLSMNYQEMLERLNCYIKLKWENSHVKYYPHRREEEMPLIEKLCDAYGWELCFSRINIELELSHGSNKPQAIIGFGSSALFLLKRLFTDIDIESVHFIESENYLNIERKYRESGITVINL